MFGRGNSRRAAVPTQIPVIVPSRADHKPMRPSEVFTPTKPRVGRHALIGRQEEIEIIVQALIEDKAHVVLYSERGRGKTSLANIIIEGLRRSGVIVAQHSCEASSTFDSIMRGLARSLPAALLANPVRAEECQGCEAALPGASLRPADIVDFQPRLTARPLICVIDEFDRVQDAATRTLLADTIKQVSDRGLPLLFMIIGVSDSLEQILGQHPSIQRNLVSVPLPLLSADNIMGLVDMGAEAAGLSYSSEVIEAIAIIAGGMPYIAQLLGLRVAQVTTRRDATTADMQTLMIAALRMIRETPAPTAARYDEITAGGEDEDVLAALRQVATATQDLWGHMSTKDTGVDTVVVGGARIGRRSWLALHEWGVLQPCTGKPGFVTFADRSLRQYILLHSVVDGTWGADPKPIPRQMEEVAVPIQRIGL